MKNRFLILLLITLILLLIPLIGTFVSDEVNWGLMDFVVGGILIYSAGAFVILVLHYIKSPAFRILLSFIIIALFLLVWAELAVGIFLSI